MGMFDDVDEDQALDSRGGEEQPEEGQPQDSEPSEGTTKEPDQEEGQEDPAEEGEPAPEESEDYEFEGVQFKGLTKEQILAIEKGTLRNKDYTQKTQGVKQAISDGVQNFYQATLRDPRLLLKYYSPDYLEHVLNGVKGQAQPNQSKINLDQFEPEVAQVITGLQNEIKGLKSNLSQYDRRFQTYEQRFRTDDEQRASQELTAEVNDALGKYKNLNTEYDRQLVLSQIANNGSISALDAAAQVSKMKKAAWTEKVNLNKGKVTKVVGAGGSAPPVQKEPTTFDEADKFVNRRLGISGG